MRGGRPQSCGRKLMYRVKINVVPSSCDRNANEELKPCVFKM